MTVVVNFARCVQKSPLTFEQLRRSLSSLAASRLKPQFSRSSEAKQIGKIRESTSKSIKSEGKSE